MRHYHKPFCGDMVYASVDESQLPKQISLE